MIVEFVLQMRSIEDAYQAVLAVDKEVPELLPGSGIILLITQEVELDWYFYIQLSNPTSNDKVRILALADKAGTRTDQRVDDLLLNPFLAGCFSGNAKRVASLLGQLVRS